MSANISRRTVLAGSGGLAMIGPIAKAQITQQPIKTDANLDVIVCGGGISGMTAAYRLHQQGAKVAVLEASDHLGGRTVTMIDPSGVKIDLGGQFVGPSQTHLLALARELGISTFKAWSNGDSLVTFDGQSIRQPAGEMILKDEAADAELAAILGKLDSLAQSVPLEAPETAPEAAKWDAISVSSWIASNVSTSAVRNILNFSVAGLFGCEPAEISMLYFVYYIHHGDSFEMLLTTRGGGQDARFHGGTQQFSTKMGEKIGLSNVLLSHPVSAIRQVNDGVVVEAGEKLLGAKFVVVAMPPGAADKITFEPRLPVDRRELQARSPMGRYIKIIARYNRPFWKDRGLNGEVFSGNGFMFGVFDESEDHANSHALVGFVAADKVIDMRKLTEAKRRNTILEELASYFGEAALSPIFYVERDWTADPWSLGGPVACPPVGALSRLGHALRQPVGAIYWAGTEAAPKWTGYMDGAVRAGERAAKLIVPQL